ncbi:MAG: hydroxypyruvate isomerase, partial [Planctomycetota bacterium]
YHTGGNPGRHEIDHTQEIYYPPIAKAIAESGFDGYVAHEFLPTGDTLESLSQAVKICTV